MTISYPAEAAEIMLCEHFGSAISFYAGLRGSGAGTEERVRKGGQQGRGGVVVLNAQATSGSHYLWWEYAHQPSIRRTITVSRPPNPPTEQPGPIVACQGGASMFARFGLTALATRSFFFGYIAEDGDTGTPPTDTALPTLLSIASDQITYATAGGDFAGILYSSQFTDETTKLRAVSSHKGLTNAAVAPVKTTYWMESDANPNDGDPEHMPGFQVQIDEDGDVHCFVNGERIADIKEGLDPLKAYIPLLMFDNDTSTKQGLWVDSFGFNSRVFGALPPL